VWSCFHLVSRAFVEKVNDGSIKIHAGDWPWFLYDNTDLIDPDAWDRGLCRGYLLVWVVVIFEEFCCSHRAYRFIDTFLLEHHQSPLVTIGPQNLLKLNSTALQK
jgi:hypothetical protein